jgi:phosphonate degradation associated HDIG domain protein
MQQHALQPLTEIETFFKTDGHLVYGEAITQLEHALQCAHLAEQAGASDALIVAALFHDVGHMLHRDAAAALAKGNDDKHEILGAKFLSRWFAPDVTQPVAFHVSAKRYLCAREAQYENSLSVISQHTLRLQGGVMTAEQADEFAATAYAMDGVSLRRWDDLAKVKNLSTPPWEHFMQIARRCADLNKRPEKLN